jgi:hypothetical protein
MTDTDERGVTVPINYLLLVGIVALLSAGLLASTSTFVETQQERAIESELQVIGNRMASDIGGVDRLAGTVEVPGSVEAEIDLPMQVAGSAYRIGIESVGGDRYRIILTSVEPDVSVSVPVRSRTVINAGGLDGGDLTVSYDSSSDELVVENA